MRVRLTLQQTLSMIAVIGVVLAAFRLHFSVGSFASGVLALTAIRTRQGIDGLRSRGLPLTKQRLGAVVFVSLTVAVVLIAVSPAAILWVYGILGGGMRLHWRHGGTIDLVALLFGLFAGLSMCTALRLVLWSWPHRSSTSPSSALLPAEECARTVMPEPLIGDRTTGTPGPRMPS